MATITLTDRISVRVTAKDSTETSNQNKTNGGNVASALGGSGLTDSEKEEVGESLGETVTDENGTTYARSDKVAGVLKKLKSEGKIQEVPESWSYAGDDSIPAFNFGLYQTVGYMGYQRSPGPFDSYNNSSDAWGSRSVINQSSHTVYLADFSKSWSGSIDMLIASEAEFTFHTDSTYYGEGGRPDHEPVYQSPGSASITNGSVYINVNGSLQSRPIYGLRNTLSCSGAYIGPKINNFFRPGVNGDGTAEKMMAIMVYKSTGVTHNPGSVSIDTTGKTDAQIQKDLEDYAAQNNCKMTLNSGDTYIAVTDANGNPLYFLGT